jgi:hypothetical protein
VKLLLLFLLSLYYLEGQTVESSRNAAKDLVVICVGYFHFGDRERLCVVLTRESDENFVTLNEIGNVTPLPRKVELDQKLIRNLLPK